MSDESRSLTLPESLVERLERRAAATEFASASEYATNVLEEVLHHVESDVDDVGGGEVDEEEVRDRLRSLGYLDR